MASSVMSWSKARAVAAALNWVSDLSFFIAGDSPRCSSIMMFRVLEKVALVSARMASTQAIAASDIETLLPLVMLII